MRDFCYDEVLLGINWLQIWLVDIFFYLGSCIFWSRWGFVGYYNGCCVLLIKYVLVGAVRFYGLVFLYR